MSIGTSIRPISESADTAARVAVTIPGEAD